MMKFTNFCGIFATVFVTTTIILLASCSQDDDYYESDMYTLAEMGTRGGWGDPGGGPVTPDTHVSEEPLTEMWEFYFHPTSAFNLAGYPNSPIAFINPDINNEDGIEAEVFIKTYRVDDVPVAELIGYISSDTLFTVTDVEFKPDFLPGRYTLWANGYDDNMIPHSAVIFNHVFN